MKYTEPMRNAMLIAGLALIGAIATLPLAIESFRALDAASVAKPPGTVKLVCFDRAMRALACDVASGDTIASRVTALSK